MTALTQDRATESRLGDFVNDPVAAGKLIYAGSLVVLSATGYAEPGITATTVTARGRAEEQADNTGGADGAITIKVRRGIFKFANDAGDAVTRAMIGDDAYIVDDQTVAGTSGTNTRSVAGTIIDLDSDGVWVQVG
jgi:hypothetical protein